MHRLFNDDEYRMSLLIGCGILFGLQISDIFQLAWEILLLDKSLEIIEKKSKNIERLE